MIISPPSRPTRPAAAPRARRPRTDDHAQISGALGNVCRKALALQPQDSDTARAFFEQNFQPVRIARLGEGEGLRDRLLRADRCGFALSQSRILTCRSIAGRATWSPTATSPARPRFPNKGGRIGRRTEGNDLVPYYDRGAIEAGALDGQKLEICWIKDPLDLVAIQIEGSARVILEDGTPLRISYDSHNGYSYSSVERVLIERNLIPREEMSMQRIRDWMAAHPEEAAKVRAVNRSYVFFRVTGLTNDGEPVGAQGVPLTPGRSIAVDRVHVYGTPFFIEAQPAGREREADNAVPPPDDRAGHRLGDRRPGARRSLLRRRRRGRPHRRPHPPSRPLRRCCVPRELDLVEAASEMPLPVPKPKIAEDDGGKADTKPDGKGKAEPAAGSPAPAPGKPVPLPVAKTKIAVLDVGKAERERKAESAGAVTDGRRTPALAPKTKIAVTEGKKPDRKGKIEFRQRCLDRRRQAEAVVGGEDEDRRD